MWEPNLYLKAYTCSPCIQIVPCVCARHYRVMEAQVHTHSCEWTIYLARPCTGHNVYAGLYMSIYQGNDFAPVFIILD